jgi:serine/threonine-protein kinase
MMLGAVAGGSRLDGEPTMVQARSAGTTVLPVTETRGIGAPPPNDGSRGWVYALIGLLLLLLLVGGYFLGRHEGWFGSSVKNLTIPPNLVNQPAPAAQTELQQKGFTNVTTHPLASSTIVSGNVVSSTPGPGATVKSNAAVVLNVSSGPTQVTVPTVAGQTQALATQALRKAGFVVNPTSQSSSSVPQGTVIGTSPTGGQPAAQGSAVTMIVSSGKQLVKIPPLVGEDPATAGQQLGALQLVVTPMDEASPTLPAGQVTRTDPAAGTPVPVGSTVIVYVSTGPPQVQVPDLSNQTRSQADQALKAVGLKGAFTTVPVSDRSQAGIVQSQSPSAPTSVPQGSTVDVAIGTYQPPTTTTSTIPGPLSGGGGSSG